MNWTYLTIVIILAFGSINCQAQTKKNMENNNPLLCNPDSGICEIPAKGQTVTEGNKIKPPGEYIFVGRFFFEKI